MKLRTVLPELYKLYLYINGEIYNVNNGLGEIVIFYLFTYLILL